jgi:endonuclease/exonuclease/phosphatase (EEP) superfamily protein YafD
MKLVTYNVFKANIPGLQRRLNRFIRESDFVLIQEWTSALRKLSEHTYVENFAFTFPLNKTSYGTCIAFKSKYRLVNTLNKLTRSKELGIATKKSYQILTFKVRGREFVVVNLHALNFVHNKFWKKELERIIADIPKDIPAIVAGDFNTWNSSRFDFLEYALEKEGFRYCHYDHRLIFRLDHIFYRGIEINSCECLRNVHNSDHYPLQVDFNLYK